MSIRRICFAMITCSLVVAAASPLAASAAASDTTCIALSGHLYGQNGNPSPAFLAIGDTLEARGVDAFVSGGDITEAGTAAQWNAVLSEITSWSFPFIPVLGNHDAINLAQWNAIWGTTYDRYDVGSTRILTIDCILHPGGGLVDPQKSWFLGELVAAAADTAVERVLVAGHKHYALKQHARYAGMERFVNAWNYEFHPAGYDLGNFSEEIWPAMVALDAVKPVVWFSGDTGVSAAVPSLFHDELDGIAVLSCGTRPILTVDKDAFLLMYAVSDTVWFEPLSPWNWGLNPVETYDPAFWTAFFATAPTAPVPVTPGPPDSAEIWIPPGNFEMGDHLTWSGAYAGSTGYSVTLSAFVMTTAEITVSEYIAFLNAEGNLYQGTECLDLDDPQAQIEDAGGGVYQAKPGQALDEPVVEVTWFGAVAYCNYRSLLEGYAPVYAGTTWTAGATGWRLPTEAEFEYAQRGGEGYAPGKPVYTRFAWADDSPDHIHEHANVVGTGGADVWDGLAPVRSFDPDQYGVYDLSGNAFEWVFDPWTPPEELGGAATDPVSPGDPYHPTWKVIRGGGYSFHWMGARNAHRAADDAAQSHAYLGFRMVRAPGSAVLGTTDSPDGAGTALWAARNPVRAEVRLGFRLGPADGEARLSVYDLRGREVFATAVHGSSGEVRWDLRGRGGRPVAAGSYFVVLDPPAAGRRVLKVTVLK